jgi:hypothetical protein
MRTCDAVFLFFCEIILEFLSATHFIHLPIHFLNRWRLVLTLAALQVGLAILELTLAAFQLYQKLL